MKETYDKKFKDMLDNISRPENSEVRKLITELRQLNEEEQNLLDKYAKDLSKIRSKRRQLILEIEKLL